jgi:glycosyltransferase involved in cell wall biosynthesis
MGASEGAVAIAPGASRPRRVLEVLYSFRIGGSELLGLELAAQLAAEGTEVFCTALDGMQGPLVARCAEQGIRVVDIGLPKPGLLARNGVSLDLARRLRALELDAIHLQHFLGLNKLGLPARLAGVSRIVVTEHSVLDVSQSLAGRLRVRAASRLAHAITVIHPSIKDYLVGTLGVSPARVSVIPVGVDLARWHADDRAARRAALGIDSEFTAVFAGRIAPVKNVPGLIRGFLDAAEATGVPARLVVVGDGPDMAASREAAAAHALSRLVTFAGEQSDTRPFVAAGDVFIMNSLSEGTPRALLEAMACGLPGISTAVGGVPSLLENRGWLAAPADPAAFTATVAEAMRSRQEIPVRGARAREFVRQHFDASQALAGYRSLLLPS